MGYVCHIVFRFKHSRKLVHLLLKTFFEKLLKRFIHISKMILLMFATSQLLLVIRQLPIFLVQNLQTDIFDVAMPGDFGYNGKIGWRNCVDVPYLIIQRSCLFDVVNDHHVDKADYDAGEAHDHLDVLVAL